EVYRGRPIIYDAGDFVDDYAVDRKLRNDQGLLFRLEVADGVPRRLDLIPVQIGKSRETFCQVNLATGADREAIAERITALSGEMATVAHRKDARLGIEVNYRGRRASPPSPRRGAGSPRRGWGGRGSLSHQPLYRLDDVVGADAGGVEELGGLAGAGHRAD